MHNNSRNPQQTANLIRTTSAQQITSAGQGLYRLHFVALLLLHHQVPRSVGTLGTLNKRVSVNSYTLYYGVYSNKKDF